MTLKTEPTAPEWTRCVTAPLSGYCRAPLPLQQWALIGAAGMPATISPDDIEYVRQEHVIPLVRFGDGVA